MNLVFLASLQRNFDPVLVATLLQFIEVSVEVCTLSRLFQNLNHFIFHKFPCRFAGHYEIIVFCWIQMITPLSPQTIDVRHFCCNVFLSQKDSPQSHLSIGHCRSFEIYLFPMRFSEPQLVVLPCFYGQVMFSLFFCQSDLGKCTATTTPGQIGSCPERSPLVNNHSPCRPEE